jgi:hypothetical protein
MLYAKDRPMTTVKIELRDEQAAALNAKAADQGITLERWIQNLAEREASNPISPRANSQLTKQPGSVVEEMRKLRSHLKPDREGWTTRDYINYGRR